ncbi:hypothetical protein COK41_14925 [Bacillus cereus]|nr:hypothetical protein COK41_14925 [Bacillus cereus]
MQVIYSTVFDDFFDIMSTDKKEIVQTILTKLESITNRIEIEQQFQLVKTRRLDSVERYTYIMKLDQDIRLIFRIENNVIYMDNIIFKNSLMEKYLNNGGENA